MPDRTGALSDIVLGTRISPATPKTVSTGAIVGRVANRIKNAEFTLRVSAMS